MEESAKTIEKINLKAANYEKDNEKLRNKVRQLEAERNQFASDENKKLLKDESKQQEECNKPKKRTKILEDHKADKQPALSLNKVFQKESSEQFRAKCNRARQILVAKREELADKAFKAEDAKTKAVYSNLIKEMTAVVNLLDSNDSQKAKEGRSARRYERNAPKDKPSDCLSF
eukprot:TRINITY_DN8062_c0_g3_i2.p2 TRINITY_DN8062_c0_g3~~TRINITY_DN8062_c0_g3_i2.p2  ORF type:complete len:174 (+),score=40.61 TRINITY_DN8062_c0_g3_i2:751-1272(+)